MRAQSVIAGCLYAIPMTPSICSQIRSFYYPVTRLAPVDLEAELPKYICPDAQVVATAQKLMSDPEVQRVFSEPLSYDREGLERKNSLLQDRGFSILGERPVFALEEKRFQMTPCYAVSEHPSLPNWVVKAAGMRIPEDVWMQGPLNDHGEMCRFSRYEGLLRLKMNERMRRIAEEVQLDVRLPKEYAVPYSEGERDLLHRVFVLSEKLDLKSMEETVAHIAQMGEGEQIELAKKIAFFIQKAGFVDASFHNIRFTTEGQLTIIDAEPIGLYGVVGDSSKSHSLEKCVRIGLFTLKTFSQQKGLNAFSQEVDRHYAEALQERSVKRIVLSIACPLIPLALLVIAIVNAVRIWWHALRVVACMAEFGLSQQERIILQQEDVRAFQRELKPLLERYYAAIEGIPFSLPVMSLGQIQQGQNPQQDPLCV